jgi:hypothetical protein
MIYFYINCTTLFIALLSTYSINTNTNLYFCCQIIGIYCFIDIFLHIFNIQKIKFEFLLHHFFALLIIGFLRSHYFLDTYKIEEKNDLIKNILCVEISSIFLSIREINNQNILIDNDTVNRKESIILKINDVLFVLTFIYYRIYNYTVNIILSEKFYLFVINISIHKYHSYYLLIGSHGLFLLNCYWFNQIIKTIYFEMILNSKKEDQLDRLKNT